jgi:Terminase large subunit, T4likevirus-type, N-terminal
MTGALDKAALLRAVRDPVEFARVLCGAPLWDHQASVGRSKSRYRVICAGRQVGKSRLLAVLALHRAFSQPGSLTLIVSAGEDAAKRLLTECAALAGVPLLAGSVVEDQSALMLLSNGSQIKSVPASQKQIRGNAVDLLIIDESGWVDTEVFRAGEPAIIARPGSQIIAVSSPWGSADHWYRKLWQRGMDSPDAMYESWHWPSTASPMVDAVFLEEIRKRETSEYFRREYLAEWTDDSGTFLSEAEISACVAGYEMLTPERVAAMSPWSRESERRERCFTAVAGVDWAFSNDAQALVLLSALDDGQLNHCREHKYYVPWMQFAYRTPYAEWVDTCVQAAEGYGIRVFGSETNGVGAYPTEALSDTIQARGNGTAVAAVWTDQRRKQSGFGKIKMMLQRNMLVLPREPELLKQLRALEFEQSPGGGVKIAVPERAGHDDLAMALMQGVSCLRPAMRGQDEIPERLSLPYETTPGGTIVPLQPRPVEWHSLSYVMPSGKERDPGSAW